jgi:hypothetical protein
LVIFNIFKQQRGTTSAGDFPRNGSDLFVPIDLGANTLQLASFLEQADPVTQISNGHGKFS